MTRPTSEIEKDITNILFNTDCKNKVLSIQLLPNLFNELKVYHPIITQEHIFEIVFNDERAKEKDKTKISNRVTRVLSKLGIKKKSIVDFKREWDFIKRNVDVPQYQRKWVKVINEIYPSITETEYKQDLEFTYTGIKRFQIGTLLKPLVKKTYRELIL